MPSSKKKSRHLIAMWDMYGLETVQDVDAWREKHKAWEKENTWNILKDEPRSKKPPAIPLPMMMLRARVNAQRQYEIYEFNSEFSKTEVETMFKKSPQTMADTIRRIGMQLYSDRVSDDKIKIR